MVAGCACLLTRGCRLLRADQKAKARSRFGAAPGAGGVSRAGVKNGVTVLDDDMAFFWQCQSPGTTGEIKGCSFFKILDMRGEGRGPCVADEEEDEGAVEEEGGEAVDTGAAAAIVGDDGGVGVESAESVARDVDVDE